VSWGQYKRIVAEQSLQITVLKYVIEKKALGPAEKRALVQYTTGLHGISIRQALKTFDIRPLVYYYKRYGLQDIGCNR
jgi:hypothetical protein